MECLQCAMNGVRDGYAIVKKTDMAITLLALKSSRGGR